MFSKYPTLSGSRQTSFHGSDQPSRIFNVSNEKLNQQLSTNLNWNSLVHLCKSFYSTIRAFAVEHSKAFSTCGQYLEYLNPALFITMINKEENPTYSEALGGPDSAGFMEEMKKEEREELLLLKEENVARYLDFHIDRRSDGSLNFLIDRRSDRSIHLNQKGLIHKILDAVHLNEDSITSVETPSTNYLPIDLLGGKAHVDFNYTSINGQLIMCKIICVQMLA